MIGEATESERRSANRCGVSKYCKVWTDNCSRTTCIFCGARAEGRNLNCPFPIEIIYANLIARDQTEESINPRCIYEEPCAAVIGRERRDRK
jgi:hypothetical protein